MAVTMTPDQQKAKCVALRSKWSVRNKKFVEWYDMLKLTDVLKQENMESVATNDPRTGFNLGRHLLVSSIVSHRIDQDGLTAEEVMGTSYLERYVERRWLEQENRYRQAGKQGWLWTISSWLLTTGWYAVFAMVEQEKIYAEIWSPAETFPDYDNDGMSAVAHIYSVSPAMLAKKAKELGWTVEPARTITIIYDLWEFDEDGNVVNSIVVGSKYAKPPTVDSNLSELKKLPVLMAPAGGLPDTGSLDTSNWQAHYGEAIIATNEELVKNYNKMLSYIQQIARDSANPKWMHIGSSENAIKLEDLFKRGAVFEGSPGDSLTPIGSPPIPIELRQAVMDYQNMVQRGSFPWTMFGNVQQQISYLAMANIAASSMQAISPYANSLRGLLNDVDDLWKGLLELTGFKPHNYKKPAILPLEYSFNVGLEIEIPGYLVQRATIARQLDPQFRLSTSTVMDKLFPEIKNSLVEQGKARKDLAMSNPKVLLAESIIAYKEQARLLKSSDNPDDSEIAGVYDKLVSSLEQELSATIQQPSQATGQPGELSQNLPQIGQEV